MEVDEIQCNKFPRLSSSGNGRFDSANKLGHKMDDDQQYNQDNDEEEGENNRTSRTGTRGGGGSSIDLAGRFYGWPSSRIVRVSRASGGKDRHSKVLTSKGLRDRRVRLSVNTAIQFYDLQDRLGCDQPSKAFEWLLKAAASSIGELPPISPFPGTPNRQLSDEKISSTGGGISDNLGVEVEMDMDGGDRSNYSQQAANGNGNANPSACSSTSETSKGSGISLSRSESRIKARERAKERVAVKEKKENNNDGNSNVVQVASMANPISQTTSFTELLSTGINNSPNGSVHQNPNSGPSSGGNDSNFFQKSPMDYFTTGHLAAGNSLVSVAASPLFGVAGGDHHQQQHAEIAHLSFVPDHHLVSVVNAGNSNSNHSTTGSSEYNLNFTISSGNNNNNTTVVPGLAGFNNRGTLQSNLTSPSSLLPQLQLGDGSHHHHHQSFFVAPHVENNHHQHHHHQFLPGYDARLQLFYADPHHQAANNHNNNGRYQKGKGKN